MPAQRRRMSCQEPGAFRRLDPVRLGTEECGQGRLGVHDQALVARESDYHVGAHSPLVTAHGADLFLEVAPRQHARVLQDSPQLDLTPVTPDRGGVQGPHQGGGLGAQCVGGASDVSELNAHLGELLDAVPLQGPHLAFDSDQRIAQRCEHGCGLGVIAHRGLKVNHPLTHEVSFGGQGRGAALKQHPGDEPRRQGTDERSDHCSNHDLHVSTVSESTDSHPFDTTKSPARGAWRQTASLATKLLSLWHSLLASSACPTSARAPFSTF